MTYYVLIGVTALFVLWVFIKGWTDEKEKEKSFLRALRDNHGGLPDKAWKPECYEHLGKYHEKHGGNFQIDDITWNDLGMDRVWERLDYTLSETGAEYLYHTLRTPVYDRVYWEQTEPKIAYFTEHEEERVFLQSEFAKMGTMGKYSIYDSLDHLEELGKRSSLKHYIANLLLAAGVLLLLVSPGIGITALLLLVFYNMMTYFKEKAQVAPYITAFSYIMKQLRSIDRLSGMEIPVLAEETAALRTCRKAFSGFDKGAWILLHNHNGAGDLPGIFLNYICMIFHLDLIRFNSMLSEVKKHREDVDSMVTLFGQLELYVCIESFRASLKHFSVPVFTEDNSVRMENGYHLLLQKPVKNSVTAEKGVLLTGSNASGKSTFLKTVALNALLAQSIHTCLADGFSLPFCRIYSSMALRDDILSGDSYFMVEIKALKRILEAADEKEKRPVLCFIDEVLRGTNTVERIAASTELLKGLSKRGVMTFAATHDVELTRLLEDEYTNYHFEEEVIGRDVVFSYELKEGKAVSRNAIRLLEVMGYDSHIVDRAQKRAEVFMQEGIWEK